MKQNKMIKILSESLLICLVYTLASCSHKVDIKGEMENKSSEQVFLYAYHNGDIRLVDQQPSVNGSFQFQVEPENDGFYLIGDNENVLFPLYLEKGGHMNVKICRDRLELDKNSDKVNKLLYQWEDKSVAVREHAYLHAFIPKGRSVHSEEFFKELTALADACKEYDAELNNYGDKEVAELFRYKSQADLNFYALSYLKNEGIKTPDIVNFCDYYQTMNPDKLFQDKKLLNIPNAGQMLDVYVWYKHKDMQLEDGEKYDYQCLKELELQQEYILNLVSRFKYHDEYRELSQELKSDIMTTDFEKRLQNMEKELLWSAPGVDAPDFKGLTPDSTWISRSDFEGKVLVVDVWATWCTPCRRMMPYFVELEKEFKDQDVEFLSVCMGVSIERDTWLEIIQKHKLPGHHCFIDSWTGDFAQNYKVTGVPRYMVFDREGRIVSVNAPKPNKPGLKDMILKTLNNK